MTDEEMACKDICDSIPCKTMCTKCKCYIAGLKAGKSQWHKVADGLKIKEVDISDNEPIFCEVCGKEFKGKSIGVKTEYPIHEMTKFILCSDCQKKIRQDITDDLLEYERKKVIEWVRKNKELKNVF